MKTAIEEVNIMQTKLTVATVDVRTDKSGNPYGYITGHITKKDETTREVVAMAFGKAFENTRRYLKEGKTVQLTAQFDGGVLKILGRRAGAGKPATAAA